MDAVRHMGELSIGRLLVRYSLPAIAGFLANALYHFVDRILVGRGVGTDGMAAVTSAFPLTIVAMALGLLVGTDTGNRISVLLGQLGFYGMYLVGPCADLPFAVVAGVLMVRELARLRPAPVTA